MPKKGVQKRTDAERLLRLRELLNFSQRDLAKEFGVTQGAIGFWERGERPVPGPILKLIEIYELRPQKLQK